MNKIDIKTRDGTCPCYVYHPPGKGPWPAVLVYMDGLAIRPAMLEVGERLATYGYYVLLPDLFYRSGPYEPLDPHTVFNDPEKRKYFTEKLFKHATQSNIMSDTRAFLDYLASVPEVKPGGIGTTGYCMGGAIALAAAGMYPDKIVAAASFHGGNLATDSEVSPHLLAPAMKARIYVAAAEKDMSYPPEMAALLEQSLTSAGVDHRCETYAGTVHGWTMPDTPRYNAEATERHWHELFSFFDATLRQGANASPPNQAV